MLSSRFPCKFDFVWGRFENWQKSPIISLSWFRFLVTGSSSIFPGKII